MSIKDQVAEIARAVAVLQSVIDTEELHRAGINVVPELHNGLTMDDWRMLVKHNKNVLVGARNVDSQEWKPRYLKEINEDDKFICWVDGGTSKTTQDVCAWNQCLLIEDDGWRINEGFQMVPDDVKIKGGWSNGCISDGNADEFNWVSPAAIMIFRIIGVEGE